MNFCERCETCEPAGVFLLNFADESRFFRLCLDCLDLYRFAIHIEEDEEEEGDPCEVAPVKIVENTEDPK